MKTSGVYRIHNTKNNREYVGSSKNLELRKNGHLRSLRNNSHYSKKMQNDFNLFGEKCFYFETIIICEPEHLLYYEQKSIDEIVPEYNSSPTAGSQLGYRHRQETKNQISEKKKGIPRIWKATQKMIDMLAERNVNNDYPAKEYENFISPNGNVIGKIFNLNKFCRENGLDCAHMTDVYYGKRKSHKGWTKG